jgi:hypothetical protein
MKTRIIYHKFLGSDENGFTYEIKFNKSLENTVRMNSMCYGLDRYDRFKWFWMFVHNMIAHPLLETRTKWAARFHNWTAGKF